MKKFLSLTLALFVAVSMLSISVFMASAAATTIDLSAGSFTITADGDYVVESYTGSNTLTIKADATVTLEGVNITADTDASAISIESGNVTLNVSADSTLTGGDNGAGIYVAEGASLTVKGGKLTAIGNAGTDDNSGAAGIGGTWANGNSGAITIDGATVVAEGYGVHGSGIGSGSGKVVGEIKILGGANVTAQGGYYANGDGTLLQSKYGKSDPEGGAAIGGGAKTVSTIADITITDSTVVAYGGSKAAGIGANFWSNCGTITISGSSNVTAQGGSSSAGIGTSRAGDNGVTADIVISGGVVNATGGAYGAGIGGGYNNDSLGNGESSSGLPEISITISGGDITACGGEGGAGIGGGYKTDNVNIDINGATVEAEAGALVSGKTVENGGEACAIGSGANGSGTFENSPAVKIATSASVSVTTKYGGKPAIEGMTDEKADKYNFIVVSVTGKPVTNINELQKALESEKEIKVSKTFVIKKRLTIPADVTITVEDGEILYVAQTLKNNGTINGKVVIATMVYRNKTRENYNVTRTRTGSITGNMPANVSYAISLDNGYTWIDDTNNGNTAAVLVKTDGTKVLYTSFQTAFTSARTGETVHMLKDAYVTSTNPKANNGPLRSYYGLILEGNCHTIYTNLEPNGASNDYATIKFTSYLAGTGPDVRPVLKNVTIDSQKNAKADLDIVSGDVTFTVSMYNVTLLGNCQYAKIAFKSPSLIINKSNVNIYDCSIPSWDAGSAKAINLYSGEYALSFNSKCTVYGGTYTKDPTKYVAEGRLVETNAGKYIVKIDPAYGMVAKIGDKYYKTIAAAVNKAVNGDTITLIDDVVLTDSVTINGKELTIDLGGYTVSNPTGTAFIIRGSTETGDADVTIKNGTVKGNSNLGGTIKVGYKGTLNLVDGVTVNSNVTLLVCDSNGKIIITGGSYTADVNEWCEVGYKAVLNTTTGYYDVDRYYAVEIADTENGEVKANLTEAKEGETITLTVTPGYGYLLDAILVNGVSISGKTFTMPAEDVEVEVSFIKSTDTACAQIFGSVVLKGGEIKAGAYKFELRDKNGNVVGTATNGANGEFKFKAIKYKKPGIHKFTIAQISKSASGVTLDKTVFTATVYVAYNAEADLKVVITLPKDIEFRNEYSVKSTSAKFSAKAVYDEDIMRSGSVVPTKLVLRSGSGAILETLTTDANGNVNFSEVTFEKAGTYTFYVEQIKGGMDGITYDTELRQITVTVTDNGQGALIAKVSGNNVVFNNTLDN